jgi:hypothetical protein
MLHHSLLYVDSLVAASLSAVLFISPKTVLAHVFPGFVSSHATEFLAAALSVVYFNLAMIAYYSTSMPSEQAIKPARCALLYHAAYSYVLYTQQAKWNNPNIAVYCYGAVAYHVIMAAVYTVAMATAHPKQKPEQKKKAK